jgi:deoxyhypusine synthase
MTTVRAFIDHHFHHFNARELKEAAEAYEAHIEAGGKMMVTLAGAMSTAGIGRILAPAIREGLVHAITCTGANLEEDAYRLIGHNKYESLPDWRALSADDDEALYARNMNRVTDTAIPDDVMIELEGHLLYRWKAACNSERSDTPAAFLLDALQDEELKPRFQNREQSWLLAADDYDIPIWTPGWEDSTSGNTFAAAVMKGEIPHHDCVESGTAQMQRLVRWYLENCDPQPGIGYFQLGGGIAGDFSICVVPLITKDLKLEDTPAWGYFCQISDAVTSYGGYSGATPDEKITWGKLDVDTPKFMIESDATIVAPLIWAYLLGG